jgi:glycerol kinase
MLNQAILAIDQGSTNSKAILVAIDGIVIANGSALVKSRHPKPGWVEQDANQIWASLKEAIESCLKKMPNIKIASLGISNQRESILIWDRSTGEPIGPVITWQCRRTANICNRLKAEGHEKEVIRRTGLPLDPLFPATKARWLLDQFCTSKSIDNICLGTVDSWLIWKLSGQKVHVTDASNAARTQLYNIVESCWDHKLCELFQIPTSILPTVQDSSSIFAKTQNLDGIPDGIPIASAIGDSHSALFSHGAFNNGDGKVTFGTGSSIMTTIPEFIFPPRGLTTTIAWSLNGKPTYAFEGNILVSASILPWVAQLLGLSDADEVFNLAKSVESSLGVSLVPAHVGLGSPHWNAEARGLICGLSFGSGPAHIARAALESIALQVYDIFKIIERNTSKGIGQLFVDGGPSKNLFLMQLVAGYLNHSVIIRESSEASAVGAAYLAGLEVGFWPDIETVVKLSNPAEPIVGVMAKEDRMASLISWETAIHRTLFTK